MYGQPQKRFSMAEMIFLSVAEENTMSHGRDLFLIHLCV
jgi:hypothetical protein